MSSSHPQTWRQDSTEGSKFISKGTPTRLWQVGFHDGAQALSLRASRSAFGHDPRHSPHHLTTLPRSIASTQQTMACGVRNHARVRAAVADRAPVRTITILSPGPRCSRRLTGEHGSIETSATGPPPADPRRAIAVDRRQSPIQVGCVVGRCRCVRTEPEAQCHPSVERASLVTRRTTAAIRCSIGNRRPTPTVRSVSPLGVGPCSA